MEMHTVRTSSDPPWIFVSHASADLIRVREVRNYLEGLGAAPLLFHLRALAQPEEFWPLIKREIMARNFFLFCESEAATQSIWVQRERAVVKPLAASGTVKVGTISVQGMELDLEKLRQFVSRTRCYVSYSRIDSAKAELVGQALRNAGFQTFVDNEDLKTGVDWAKQLETEIGHAAQFGFVVAIITAFSITSGWVLKELIMSRELGARLIGVCFDSSQLPPEFTALKTIDATNDIDKAMKQLIKSLYAWN